MKKHELKKIASRKPRSPRLLKQTLPKPVKIKKTVCIKPKYGKTPRQFKEKKEIFQTKQS